MNPRNLIIENGAGVQVSQPAPRQTRGSERQLLGRPEVLTSYRRDLFLFVSTMRQSTGKARGFRAHYV